MIGMILAAATSLSTPALVARCDLLASHPSDPDRVTSGVESADVDMRAAETACLLAHQAAPEHARTAYHLGRVIHYQKRHAQALPYLEKAAAAGYRQSIFVLGYVLSLGEAEVPKDICRTLSLWRRSAALDHPWSGYYLVDLQLAGAFAGCPQPVAREEYARLLDLAAKGITVSASAGRVEALAAKAAR